MTDGLARVDAKLADIKAREAATFLMTDRLGEGYELLAEACARALLKGYGARKAQMIFQAIAEDLDDLAEDEAWRMAGPIDTMEQAVRTPMLDLRQVQRERLEAAVAE